MQNFEFIREFDDLQELYQACSVADEKQVEDPKASADACRKAAECSCKVVVAKLGIACGGDMSLSSLLDTEEVACALVNLDIYNPIRQIRRRCNLAVNLSEDLEGIPYVVELLHHVVGTVMVNFGYISKIPDYVSEVDHWEIPADE